MTKITIASYLIKQLGKLDITEIFGLPGDYNFEIVETIEKNQNVNWIGSTNELNGAYCADGYARQKGYGAIVTTFGVGELSAINAISGSYAENVPVMMIAGVPETKFIKNNTLLHHSLPNNYKAFYNCYKNVVEACAFLDFKNAKSEIDRLINTMVKTKKPVYIAIPQDVAISEIEDINNEIKHPSSDKQILNKAVDKIIEEIEKSKSPCVIADILAHRFEARKEVNDFLCKTKIPSTCFIRGIDVINTNTPNFLGCYVGSKANAKAYNLVNSSDCIICFGGVISDLNTQGFDFKFNINDIIAINADFVKIRGKKYNNILIKDVIKELINKTNYKSKENFERDFIYKELKKADDEKLNYEYLYPRLEKFLKENDTFINEVGLTSFGTMPMKLPQNIDIHNQMLWGSIGWATPCAFGCSIADRKRRTILITGDGSFQLTAQEISAMMRYKVNPVIFIINNKGYTVERLLCGDYQAKYNDIADWNYSKLPEVFAGECFSAKVKTNKELDEILEKIESFDNKKMCLTELILDPYEYPELAQIINKHKY